MFYQSLNASQDNLKHLSKDTQASYSNQGQYVIGKYS